MRLDTFCIHINMCISIFSWEILHEGLNSYENIDHYILELPIQITPNISLWMSLELICINKQVCNESYKLDNIMTYHSSITLNAIDKL